MSHKTQLFDSPNGCINILIELVMRVEIVVIALRPTTTNKQYDSSFWRGYKYLRFSLR